MLSAAAEISRAVAVLASPLRSEGAAANSSSSQMLLTILSGSLSPGVPRNPIRVLQLGKQSFMAPSDRRGLLPCMMMWAPSLPWLWSRELPFQAVRCYFRMRIQFDMLVALWGASQKLPESAVLDRSTGFERCLLFAVRCILHLSCIGNCRSDLQAALESLLGSEGGSPKAAFAALYTQRTGFSPAPGVMPDNVALCQPPDESAGYQEAIGRAEQGFRRLFPNKEFLPELAKESDAYDSD